MPDDLDTRISELKRALDALRPLSAGALAQLQKHYDVELTFTSNPIEGNTLTLRETAEVIEHGVTVGGKSLREHLEALDHYEALLWMRELAAGEGTIGEGVVCELHRRIVARSRPDIAGLYSPFARRVAGSPVIFPNPAKVPELMAAFGGWLGTAVTAPQPAFDAHVRLTAIHPFADGNGRTARLLMKPYSAARRLSTGVRPEDRLAYLGALETASTTDDLAPFPQLMSQRLAETLEGYVAALREGAG